MSEKGLKRRKFKWWVILIIIFLILFVLLQGSALWMINQMANVRVEKLENTPEDYDLVSETVTFKSQDGLLLKGWYTKAPDAKGLVIILHGLHGIDASSLLSHAKFLYDAGYSSVALDMRAHGRSEGEVIGFAYEEPKDILPVVDWAKNNQDTKSQPVFLLGISMGGASAIRAASEKDNVDGVISVSAFASVENVMEQGMEIMEMPEILQIIYKPFIKWAFALKYKVLPSRNSPVFDIQKIESTPIFIIHGDKDQQIPVENAYTLHEKSKAISEIWVDPDAKHMVYNDDGTTENDKEYRERIIRFLNTLGSHN